jgi:predicted nucleic acid-binding protein
MGAVVLDTSVVIGFLFADDAHHRSARQEILDIRHRGDQFVLPASVLAESLIAEYRVSRAAGDELGEELIAAFGPERVVDADVATAAARLCARHRSLRLPDALVIATGVVERATVLTCDKRLASVDGRIQLLEPQT